MDIMMQMGLEEFKVIQREENLEEEKKNLNIKLIGVAGHVTG